MYQTYTRTGFRGKGLSIPAVHQRWLTLRVDILPSDLQSNGIDQACPKPRWRNQSKDFASSYTNLLKNGQIWTQGRYAGRPPRRAIIRKLATYYGQGNLAHVAPWLLTPWRINSIKGATDETITRNHVQENARARNPTASDDLQTLRHTNLFVELFESPPGSSRQEKSLTKKGAGTMDISIIPWNVFLDALKKQQPGTLELWLRRWLFTNEGVIVADQRVLNVH
jgi:hypothetical protein